jgi:hypothetical protein
MAAVESSIELGSKWPVRALATVACMAAVFGASLYLVWAQGSITPFWDEWDAEAAHLYKPYLEGTLSFADLFGPHVEHRILFMRLIGLLLLEINGFWDPVLQMVCNAVIRIAGVGLLLRLLIPSLPSPAAVLLAAFTTLVCAIPFGWQNTLIGLQSPYYLLLLLGFASLLAFHGARAFSLRWWLGAVLAVASFFSLASGALTPAAIVVLHAIQLAVGTRRGPREIAGVLALALACAVLLAYVPLPSGHEAGRAPSASEFLHGFKTAAAWPFGSLPAVLLLNAPILYVAARTLIRRPPPADARWLYVALAGWIAAQIVALAYGRAAWTEAPRYRDILAVNVILNFACLLWIGSRDDVKAPRIVVLSALLWTVPTVAMLSWRALAKLPAEIVERAVTSRIQTANLRAFLATGDMAALSGKPFLHIPYPTPERLAAISGDPTIRAILHPALTGNTAIENRLRHSWLRINGLDAVETWLLERGGAILGVGVGLLLWLGIFATVSPRQQDRNAGPG